MATTIAAPAPAAASTPAPAAAPAASAPVTAPVSAPAAAAAAPAPATPEVKEIGHSGVKSAINPDDYPIREDYEKAIMAEKLGAIPEVADGPAAEEVPAEVEAPQAEVEVPAPDEEAPPVEEAAAEEDAFDLNPPDIVTPEALTQMVKDNPEFGKLLQSDAKLKGALYKTAREAAELKPYREIFPDIESAKEASTAAAQFSDITNTFMGATTREGTLATLGKIKELCYERDDAGNVVMEDGKPVIGQDFYGFVDNVVAMDLEHRRSELQNRWDANGVYHGDQKFTTQEEINAAYAQDQQKLMVLEQMLGEMAEDPAAEIQQLPENLRRQAEEIRRQNDELTQRKNQERVTARQKFDQEVNTETDARITKRIDAIIESVKKQGAVMTAFTEDALRQKINKETIAKIKANPTVLDSLRKLQRLPPSAEAKQRRLAAVDRVIELYLPTTARDLMKEAGVQTIKNAEEKRAKVQAQAAATKQTEIQGSRGVSSGAAPMTSSAAYDQAQAEWTKANPGKPFDKIAREMILPRVLQLMTARAS